MKPSPAQACRHELPIADRKKKESADHPLATRPAPLHLREHPSRLISHPLRRGEEEDVMHLHANKEAGEGGEARESPCGSAGRGQTEGTG